MKNKTVIRSGLLAVILAILFAAPCAAEFSCAAAAPKTPSITDLGNISTGINVKWKKVDAARKYRVYRRTGAYRNGAWRYGKWVRLITTKNINYKNTGLQSGIMYRYAVTFINRKGRESRKSAVREKKYLGAPAVSLETKENGVRVTWSAVKGAKKYRLFRKAGGSAWTGTKDTTYQSFLDKNCDSGKTYRYRVACIDAQGREAGVRSKEKAKYYVAPPSITLANETNGVRIVWEKVKGATSYRVYRRAEEDDWKRLGDTAKITYLNTSVETGKKYAYKVVCLNSGGNPISAASLIRSKTFTACPVLTVARREDGSAGLEVTWPAVKDVGRYRVWRMEEGRGWKNMGDVDEPAYHDGDVLSGVTYTYKAAALSDDEKVLSAQSPEASGYYYKPGVRYTTANLTYLKKEPQSDSETIQVRYMTEVLDKDIIKKGTGVWHVLEYNEEEYYSWEARGTDRFTDRRSKFLYKTYTESQKKVIDLALSFLEVETRYQSSRYGVVDEDGAILFDCSNFTAYCINMALGGDYPWFDDLTHSVNMQYENRDSIVLYEDDDVQIRPVDVIAQGEPIDLSVLQPGDLLFWNHKKENKKDGTPRIVDHVGFYLGEGEFIQCSSTFNVNVSTISEKYVTDFVGAYRLIP